MKVTTTANAKENALLERAKQGDERAFTELVRQYEDLVYNFSFKVCRDRGAATETLQDTFVNVYRKLGQFDGKSKFSTWLYTIVANNCLMKRRRAKLEKALKDTMANPVVRERLLKVDTDPSFAPGPSLRTKMANEIANWSKFIDAKGIKVE